MPYCPPALLPYLRQDIPVGHYDLCVQRVISSVSRGRFYGLQEAMARELLRLLSLQHHNYSWEEDQLISRIMITLLPVYDCEYCGRKFLRDRSIQRYCSRHCYKRANSGEAKRG